MWQEALQICLTKSTNLTKAQMSETVQKKSFQQF